MFDLPLADALQMQRVPIRNPAMCCPIHTLFYFGLDFVYNIGRVQFVEGFVECVSKDVPMSNMTETSWQKMIYNSGYIEFGLERGKVELPVLIKGQK